MTIDPDRWLLTLTGRTYKRRLDSKGCFQLGNQTYYVKRNLRGQMILIWVDGQKKQLNVYISNKNLVKTLPFKGLQNRKMNFKEYLDLMCKEAISTWRKVQLRTIRYGRVTMLENSTGKEAYRRKEIKFEVILPISILDNLE